MTYNENVRPIEGLDDADLKASLKEAGWNEHLPAIKDEHGKTIVGHRRLKIAAELGIDPVIKVVTFGDGPEADSARMQLAVVSNTGAAPLTAKDRKRLSERLFNDGMTQEEISKVLGVHRATVGRDLEDICAPRANVKPDRGLDTKGRKKSTGRPKGTVKAAPREIAPPAPKKRETPILDKARDIVRPLIAAGDPVPSRKLQDEHGISHVHFETAISVERALKEEPPVDISSLSVSAKQKLDAAINQETRRLRAEFDRTVSEKVKRLVALGEEALLVNARKHEREMHDTMIRARRMVERKGGVMSKADYLLIVSCLHPDSRNAVSLEKLRRAEEAFKAMKPLIGEEEPEFVSGVPFDLPTPEERAALKRKRRQSGGAVVSKTR
jgi:hypothetical protein